MRSSILVLSVSMFVPSAEGNTKELLELFSSKRASVSVRESKIETVGQNRIVGGHDADPTFYPFFSFILTAIQFSDGDVNYAMCGGSLVAADIVLTAAHCFVDGEVLNSTVLVNNTASYIITGYEYVRNVVDIIIHPDFEDETSKNDIALLVLSSPVTKVTPVPLNHDSSIPIDGEDLQIIGLGLLKEQGDNDDGVIPDFLQVATVQSTSVAVCAAAYANIPDGRIYPVHKTLQFCAAGVGKDSCSGDSGGPIVRMSGSSPLLIGTVSFGYGCAVPEYPGVYTRISRYTSFIEQEICDLSTSPPHDCGTSAATTLDPVAAVPPPVSMPPSTPSRAPIPGSPPSQTPVPQSSPRPRAPKVSKKASVKWSPTPSGHNSKSKKRQGMREKGIMAMDDDCFGSCGKKSGMK